MQQCVGPSLQVTHVVSQSDVVKLLWANKAVLGEGLARTVADLELDDVSGCVGGVVLLLLNYQTGGRARSRENLQTVCMHKAPCACMSSVSELGCQAGFPHTLPQH